MRNGHIHVLFGCLTAVVALVALIGCGSGRSGALKPLEQIGAIVEDKIVCDAYLYDVKHVQDGKPTSIRLDCYRIDSVMGFAGRGYLGKGAFRGRVTVDSLCIYFPSTNEFVYDAVTGVLDGEHCLNAIHTALREIVRVPPMDSLAVDSESGLLARTFGPPCESRLLYRLNETRLRLERFRISGAQQGSITGTLRESRSRVKVERRRIEIEIPESAVRLELDSF